MATETYEDKSVDWSLVLELVSIVVDRVGGLVVSSKAEPLCASASAERYSR